MEQRFCWPTRRRPTLAWLVEFVKNASPKLAAGANTCPSPRWTVSGSGLVACALPSARAVRLRVAVARRTGTERVFKATHLLTMWCGLSQCWARSAEVREEAGSRPKSCNVVFFGSQCHSAPRCMGKYMNDARGTAVLRDLGWTQKGRERRLA